MINILLADDDEGDVFLLKEAMKKTQFENTLYHCQDGFETQKFLENYDKPRPDIILLDLNMPRMSGHEILKWIKTNENYKDIPVGILTTSSSEKDIKKSYKNYANYYITKPNTFGDLKAVVKRINDFWFQTVKLP
ncbi:MAG: response regulator [Micavibrio sp.]|nr:response regulator [Micavibrio sp.]